MAWISVHQQVNGMKLRKLSRNIECSQKEALGIVVSLWLWGIDNADADGIILDAVRGDIEDLFSFGLTEGLKPGKVVESLLETGWIDETDSGLKIHDWDIWQESWYKAKVKRESNTERMRMARKNKNETEINETLCANGATHSGENSADDYALHSVPHVHASPSPSSSPSPKPSEKERGNGRWAPPAIDDVAKYCHERGNKVDPQKWFDHYLSNGWMVGKNRMKDWKAAVRTWERNDLKSVEPAKGSFQSSAGGKQPRAGVQNFTGRSYDTAALREKLIKKGRGEVV